MFPSLLTICFIYAIRGDSPGVLQTADIAVIKAAYRALVNIYHPDKNSAVDSGEKIREINNAYSVLSNPEQRSVYDIELNKNSLNVNKADLSSESPFDDDPLKEKWTIALQFYPELEVYCEKLKKLSWVLEFSYKALLLETQNYKNSKSIAEDFRFQYLSKYFGKNRIILDYAEEYILAKQIDAALYLNKVIVTIGDSVSFYDLKKQMEKKYPDSVKMIIEYRLYSGVKASNLESAVKLLSVNGGQSKLRLWGKVESQFNNEKILHVSKGDFCEYVKRLFEEKYT